MIQLSMEMVGDDRVEGQTEVIRALTWELVSPGAEAEVHSIVVIALGCVDGQ